MADMVEESSKLEENEEEKTEAEMLPPMEKPVVQKISKTKEDENKGEAPELPYKVPGWSGIPEGHYFLEVLKNGCIVKTINLSEKPYYVIGRLPVCDVVIEHPSSSRYHAVIQYKAVESSTGEKGFCIYDLGSTHGTFLNKKAVDPRKFYRLRVGYCVKFGGSSRLFILQGPEEQEEEEKEQMTGTESKKTTNVGRVMTQEEYEEWKESKNKAAADEEEGINWGFGEDAVEETAHPASLDEVPEVGDHVFKDPKKTLRGYFEREGIDLEYQVEETGPGHARSYHCRVKLPIDTASGEPLYGEATVVGKKKEAVLACATECCRLLDIHGLLRQSQHESRRHKEKNWEENDYYDSDEDNFLDRTGAVEKKRLRRMKKAGKHEESVETFETLTLKLENIQGEIVLLEGKLKTAEVNKEKENDDSLEAYMSSLTNTMDKSTKMLVRRKLFDLKKEKQRLSKLLEIARPASLPQLEKSSISEATSNTASEKTFQERGADKPAEQLTVTKTVAMATDGSESRTDEQKNSVRQTMADLSEQTTQIKSNQKTLESNIESTDISSDRTKHSTKDLQETTTAMSEKQIKSREVVFAVPEAVGFKKPRTKMKKPQGKSKSEDVLNQGDENGGSQQEQDPADVSNKESGLTESTVSSEQEDAIPRKKKKRTYGVPTNWEAVNDPTYASWMPPEDQTGDGRTHLNEKFGY